MNCLFDINAEILNESSIITSIFLTIYYIIEFLFFFEHNVYYKGILLIESILIIWAIGGFRIK